MKIILLITSMLIDLKVEDCYTTTNTLNYCYTINAIDYYKEYAVNTITKNI